MAVAVWSAPLWEPQDLQPFDKSGSVSTSSPRHCLWAGTVRPPHCVTQPLLCMPIPAAALYPETLFPTLPPK